MDDGGAVPGPLNSNRSPKRVEEPAVTGLAAGEVGEHEPERAGRLHGLVFTEDGHLLQRDERHSRESFVAELHPGKEWNRE